MSVGGATAIADQPARSRLRTASVAEQPRQRRHCAHAGGGSDDHPGYMGRWGSWWRAATTPATPQAPRVIMISRTLAAALWPGQSAVGKQLVVDYSTADLSV
jgi:hypothetical protein